MADAVLGHRIDRADLNSGALFGRARERRSRTLVGLGSVELGNACDRALRADAAAWRGARSHAPLPTTGPPGAVAPTVRRCFLCMSFAPIVVFAFRRPDHTARLLASLRANEESSSSRVYVYCDGPRSAADVV